MRNIEKKQLRRRETRLEGFFKALQEYFIEFPATLILPFKETNKKKTEIFPRTSVKKIFKRIPRIFLDHQKKVM